MTNTIGEVDDMGPGDLIFCIGTNTTECHPIIGAKIMAAKARGAYLIVADPREIDLVRIADVWLRQLPGSDVAMINAMMQVIITEGLSNEAFIAERTEKYDDFKEMALKFTPESVQLITGIPPENIRQAARAFAKADNSATYYTMGITQHTTGVDNVLSLANLIMLTGNIGRPKTGLNPLRGQNNVQGACDMGALPNVYTAYQPVASEDNRAKFAKAWGVDPEKLSLKPGRTLTGTIKGIEEDIIKALFVLGENPARSDPDTHHVEHCLHHVPFLAVQDIFLTETARFADVVLPASTFAEKDGTFSNTERRVQRVRKAIEPVKDAREDWKILAEMIRRIGLEAPYESAEDVFNEMRTVTPSYAGLTYDRLDKEKLHWPCPATDHPGTPILHIGKFSRGLGLFSPVDYRPPAEMPDNFDLEARLCRPLKGKGGKGARRVASFANKAKTDGQYPLLFTTGRLSAHYHTGSMTRRCWGLNGAVPSEAIEMNPEDAEQLGLKNGEIVKVSSRRGSLEVPVNITERVDVGVTFMTFHFTEAAANILTNSASDPVSQTPEFKVCAVRVEKLPQHAGA
jgi:formate dehydrogenase major subunit